jgi:GAF domain-containing protein
MRRRGGSEQPVKGRHANRAREVSIAAPSIAELQDQVGTLASELKEAREQQTATAELLQVINSSPGNLTPVFETILEKAHALCGVAYGSLQLYDGEKLRAVAVHSLPEPLARRLREGFAPGPNHPFRRLLSGEDYIHLRDLAEIDDPMAHATVEEGGIKTLLAVALRKDGKLLGRITAARTDVRPFTDREISLLRSFAAQAVIAMENARLLTEQREALEQQAAAAEVLQVINASRGDLQPVFEAILTKAMTLCQAAFGTFGIFDGRGLRTAATRGVPEAFARFRRSNPPNYGPGTGPGRLIAGEAYVHDIDVAGTEAYRQEDPNARGLVDLGGARTILTVALRKEGKLLGMMDIYRQEVRPYSDKEISLLQSFAAQAVIAIENARLLTETREALNRQTATAEVLQVINSSPGNLVPVFQAMLEKAMSLCEASFSSLWTLDGDRFHPVANRGLPHRYAEYLKQGVPAAGTGTGRARLLSGEAFAHIADLADDEPYRTGEPHRRALVDLGGARTALLVPLRLDDTVCGFIMIYRQEVRPFMDNQIALLQTFAAQAVVAMENARLLAEQRESLEQQTATTEVLEIINASPGNLKPVFDAMLEKATRLCGVPYGQMALFDADHFHFVAVHGESPFVLNQPNDPRPPSWGVTWPRLVAGEDVVHIPDVAESEIYRSGHESARRFVEIGGGRSLLTVALRRDRQLLGALTVYSQQAQPFSEKQIALLQSFAGQTVIAMENARLLGELRLRTEEVAELNRGLEARVAEQVEELDRVGRLKRFLAPQLAKMIVSQGDEKILESHRREIVVVFCDLRGYTAFTETAEPEEVLGVLRDYHGALGPLVSQFEGTLDQFSGDGIMVFFNDPVPIPDPAERAVRMAVAMRDAASTLIAAWREQGRELGFGVGIAQGYATLGQIGFSERSGYTAIGTVCNVAARLCGEAKDGQILLGQRVNMALKGSIATEQVGALALKGLTQPVVAYNVPIAARQPALRVIDGDNR